MNRFKIKIANKTIEIETVHVLTKALSRKFLCDGTPDFKIVSTQEDIDKERYTYETSNGLSASWDGNIEATVVLRKLAELFPEYGAFAMHGAAIAYDNNAYVFSGRSGIGKTTHIMHWLKNLPDAYVVNGDKPFILADDEPMVCGSPWAGKESMNSNTIVPIKAMAFLERAEENSIQRISFSQAFPMLYQQTYRSTDSNHVRKTLNLLKKLDGKVSFYLFKINNFKDDCFQTAYNTLVRGLE